MRQEEDNIIYLPTHTHTHTHTTTLDAREKEKKGDINSASTASIVKTKNSAISLRDNSRLEKSCLAALLHHISGVKLSVVSSLSEYPTLWLQA